jgi:sugar lactone lactonase YvrE
MAMVTGKAKCSVCGNETSTYNCGGCSQNFCRIDLEKHLQILNKQLNEIEHDHNQFRQIFNDQKDDLRKCSLIYDINKWEEKTIDIIKQTAEQCRQRLYEYIDNNMNERENKLKELTDQLRRIRKENEFNEIDLERCKEKLKTVAEQLDQPLNISIEQEIRTLINKITISIIQVKKSYLETRWEQDGLTVVGIDGYGNQLNQLAIPHGIHIDDDETMYIADSRNNRILEWKFSETNCRIVAGGNGKGNQINQLDHPSNVIIDKENNAFIIADSRNARVMQWSRQHNTTEGQIIITDIDCWGLTMDKNGSLYVTDTEKHEVRRWKKADQNGTIVAGGNGEGNLLNQLNHPTFIFIDDDYSLYVSDYRNHRVMKWIKDAKEGIIVAGGNGRGNELMQLNNPHGMIVDHLGRVYVVDRSNHRVMRWCKEAKEGEIIVGGNGKGNQPNQFKGPAGLSFDQQGNLYVVDSWNNRIQKFNEK